MRRSRIPTSPLGDLIRFSVIFGWEGFVLLYIGFRDKSVSDVVAGLVFTLLMWGMLGFPIIKEIISKRNRGQ